MHRHIRLTPEQKRRWERGEDEEVLDEILSTPGLGDKPVILSLPMPTSLRKLMNLEELRKNHEMCMKSPIQDGHWLALIFSVFEELLERIEKLEDKPAEKARE